MKSLLKIKLLTIALLLGLTACGGGGGGGTDVPPQQKTATISFATATSSTAAPLQGIQITVKLPAGVTITDLASALTGVNGVSQVIPGVYTAANQTVSFAVIPAAGNSSINIGTFAELKCDVLPGYTLDENSFITLNTPFPDLQMTGKDINGNTVDLVPQIPITISVAFGF